jgi:hypothetical protein
MFTLMCTTPFVFVARMKHKRVNGLEYYLQCVRVSITLQFISNESDSSIVGSPSSPIIKIGNQLLENFKRIRRLPAFIL